MCKLAELLFKEVPAPVVAVPLAVSVKSPKADGPVWTENVALVPAVIKGSKAGKPVTPAPGGRPVRPRSALPGAPADPVINVALTVKVVDSPLNTLRSGESVMRKSNTSTTAVAIA